MLNEDISIYVNYLFEIIVMIKMINENNNKYGSVTKDQKHK
jgi:hypothetical protein